MNCFRILMHRCCRPWLLLALSALFVVLPGRAGTVAYWRFEAGPAGANVPHGGAAGAFDGSTPDDSGNGNSLSVWAEGGGSGFAYREDVPGAYVGVLGADNRFSIKNTGGNPAAFTSAAGSNPTGVNLETFTPAQFTIEASYKPEANGAHRTVVGRDARNVAGSNGDLAALYLQIRPDDSIGIQFTDVSGFNHQAYSYPGLGAGFTFGSNPEGDGAQWYNLAAVSDGNRLDFYVNNVLHASTDLKAGGSPDRALARGAASGSGWQAGAWSVGRGLYAGGHTDRAYGFIDEVRISDTALDPSEFLFAPRARIEQLTIDPQSLTLAGGLQHTGAAYDIYHSIHAALPLVEWSRISGGDSDANGHFSFTGSPHTGTDWGFFHLRARVLPPPPGPHTYGLAGGSGSWPSDIRAQIVYAMEGAVALYNRYGTFNKHVTANYNPGVPTAHANYDGWIEFGGQIGYRTALHEISHTMGVGTHWNWSNFIEGGVWTGAHAIRQIRVFDGPEANVFSDGTHFWPYGLNFDNEGGTENSRRHVMMVAAFRRDLGIQ